MTRLQHKNVVVIGASRGIGRAIALACAKEGAAVLAVARSQGDLAELARQSPAIEALPLDAAADDAPAAVFAKVRPDVLIVSAGATPAAAPLQEQSWAQFAVNWNMDVKASFEFCKQALRAPLAPGAIVILMSSGAALVGSSNSGGYAGAKRTQMFIAQYAQRESDRRGLGIRFAALAPMGIMPETELGRTAVQGYSTYLGISPEDFLASLPSRPVVADVVEGVIGLAAAPLAQTDTAFKVSPAGLTPVGKG